VYLEIYTRNINSLSIYAKRKHCKNKSCIIESFICAYRKQTLLYIYKKAKQISRFHIYSYICTLQKNIHISIKLCIHQYIYINIILAKRCEIFVAECTITCEYKAYKMSFNKKAFLHTFIRQQQNQCSNLCTSTVLEIGRSLRPERFALVYHPEQIKQ